jgi:hypothetical protein
VLSIVLLSVAAGATVASVSLLTGSTLAAVVAGLVQVLLQPRLYSYPKILVPSLLALAGIAYARHPRGSTRFGLAAVIGAAFLLRHDLGGCAAVFAAVVAGACASTWRQRAMEIVRLASMTVALLTPYLLFVQWSEGLPQHVHNGIQFFGGEERQFQFPWPALQLGSSRGGAPMWDGNAAAAHLFYVVYLLPVAAAALLIVRRRRISVANWAVAAGMTVIVAVYGQVLLREPISARVPDLASAVAILAAWCAAALLAAAAPLGSAAVIAARTAVIVMTATSLFSVNALARVDDQIRSAGIPGGPRGVLGRARFIVDSGREWPWARRWPGGDLPAVVPYINSCTAPSDLLFATWFAPEFYFFSQRGFAAGHALLVPPSFSGRADQERALDRLRRQPVPLVLINDNERETFASDYELLDRYLTEAYAPAGQVTLSSGAVITIAARRGWTARSRYGDAAWPCHLQPPARAAVTNG